MPGRLGDRGRNTTMRIWLRRGEDAQTLMGRARRKCASAFQTLLKASLETFLLAEGMMTGMPGTPQYVEVAEMNMHKNYEEELRKAVHRYATDKCRKLRGLCSTTAQATLV